MVANHASHLDVLILATALPLRQRNQALPLAAGDTFFETPVVAVFAGEMINALPMWRKHCGRHAIETLRERLIQEPCAYILFPEGTRSRDGKNRLLQARHRHDRRRQSRPRDSLFFERHVRSPPARSKMAQAQENHLQIGPAQSFASLPNDRNGWKEVAERLEIAVRKLGDK